MNRIKIMTDSASDIPKELEEQYNIRILSFPVTVEDKGYLERVDFTNEEFYEILKKLEFNYTEEIINTFKDENISKLKTIIFTVGELFIRNKVNLLNKATREDFINVYNSCKTFENTYKDTTNEIKNFYEYYYVSIMRKLEAKN